MTRNGLLILVALFTALALFVRLENTALTQINYPPLYPNRPLLPYENIGSFVYLQNINGETVIVQSGNGAGVGGSTVNLPSTVFQNTGMYSVINAQNAGAVISTTEGYNAIRNGGNMEIARDIRRMDAIWMEVVERRNANDVLQGYEVRYIATWVDVEGNPVDAPPPAVPNPWGEGFVISRDNLPDTQRSATYQGNLLFNQQGVAFIPTALNSDFADWGPGRYDTFEWEIWTGVNNDGEHTGSIYFTDSPNYDLWRGTEIVTSSPAYLTINDRAPSAAPTFVGDDRLLIESSEGTAIANGNSTLVIYDSHIRARNAGILNEGTRWLGPGIDDWSDYPDSFPPAWGGFWADENNNSLPIPESGDVILYNTQIGDTGGIAVNAAGTPIQIISYLGPRQQVKNVVNDRIVAGQDVTLARNIIGQMVHSLNPETGKTFEYQQFYKDYIDGPIIGIHSLVQMYYPVTQIFPNPDADGDPPSTQPNNENAPGYRPRPPLPPGYEPIGMSDYIGTASSTSSPNMSSIVNYIELHDNSWIFAGTGISFGGGTGGDTDNYAGGSGIRVAIDHTSGIYTKGTGSYLATIPAYAAFTVDVFNSRGIAIDDNALVTGNPIRYPEDYTILYNYGYDDADIYGGYGITDRYSLIGLAVPGGDGDDTEAFTLPYAGYSGSFHEILLEGKVLASGSNMAGIQVNPSLVYSFLSTNGMTNEDKRRFSRIYYYDPNDPDAGTDGRVYYYDPNRDEYENYLVAQKFVAYNNQPNRIFWVQLDGMEPIRLTYYDNAALRWTVHPDAAKLRSWSNPGNNALREDYFIPFDNFTGVGIDIVGTSLAYEGSVGDAWTAYYGPTVRDISVRGDDALVTGGQAQNYGAAMFFGPTAHVSKVIIGDNHDVKNLSDVLFVTHDSVGIGSATTDVVQSAKNFRAFDMMTSAKRDLFLYDPLLVYTDSALTPEEESQRRFHFDNAGVHGDIVSNYNGVVYFFGGSGDDWETTLLGVTNPFWQHSHDNTVIYYYDEILGIGEISGGGDPSYVLGHRSGLLSDESQTVWTADNIPGQSIVLDEVLLWFLAEGEDGGRQNANSNRYTIDIKPSFENSYGYASGTNGPSGDKGRRHFREALARFIHYGSPEEFYGNYSITAAEMLAGYTQDGTLLIFSSGDIFSGNIYGGGVGDSSYVYSSTGTYSGNIDLRVVDGTTIFNRNIIEVVNGSNISREPGIRVRDVYVEKTGHLMLNDSQFAVNPFLPFTYSPDYAERLIIHDVLNEGLTSGNGVFQIARRSNFNTQRGYTDFDYFDGYFINRGVLAPGLPGFIGETEKDARDIEKAYHEKFLRNVSQASGDVYWEDLMRGVPGGQYGAITIFGSLQLMDEQSRQNFDINSPLYNTLEILPAGEYHVTVGHDTMRSVFDKYVSAIDQATSIRREETRVDGTKVVVYDESLLKSGEVSKEDWQIIAAEKLGTHLSWFTPSAFVDKHTRLPLLNQYEQFEYLTNPARRAELQRKLLAAVLSEQELRQFDANPVERARLTRKILEENKIQLELTQTDKLLWRFGFSDVISVHGTVPAYVYERFGWTNDQYDLGSVPGFIRTQFAGTTQLGGIIQADRIYDLDDDADKKDKVTSYIIIVSEDYTSGSSIKAVTSATNNWVYANVGVMPYTLASEQKAAVLTVIDDPHYYRNRVSMAGKSHNARAVAGALDDAMFTNPGLAQSFQFGLNSPEVLHDVFRQAAAGTRANSVVMNVWSPSENLFNRIGYGSGGMSTGSRGDVVYRNIQNGQLQQPYGQPAVPPPGYEFAPPPPRQQLRGQSPFYRTGSVWGSYSYSTFSMGDDKNSFKYAYHRNGAMFGNEWNLTPSSVIGGFAMVNEGALGSWSDKVKSFDYDFGVYFVAAPYEQFELKSYTGIGFQSYSSDRYIRNSEIFLGGDSNNLFGINDHYDSETDGTSFNYAVEFARPFTVNPNFVIRPAMGFEIQSVRQKGYTERAAFGSPASWSNSGTNIADDALALGVEQGPTSGNYAMSFKSMHFDRSLLRLGFNTESYFARGGLQFRAYHVGRLTGDRYPVSRQSFASGSQLFGVRGAELGNSYAQIGFGSHFWLNQDRSATLFMSSDWNFSLVNSGYNMLNLNIGFMQNF